MSVGDHLWKMSIEELEFELKELDIFYRKKHISTKDFDECVHTITIVLKEKRQTQNTMDAYRRAMTGI